MFSNLRGGIIPSPEGSELKKVSLWEGTKTVPMEYEAKKISLREGSKLSRTESEPTKKNSPRKGSLGPRKSIKSLLAHHFVGFW
jgi:hypothetical protein